MKVTTIKHPLFSAEYDDWEKYRYTYKGGKEFVDRYLEKLSTRENEADFARRKRLTYSPSFAKAAINEIKNVIFNRLRDVTRISSSESYKECVQGNLKGVDNCGSTMDYFIGQLVIPELLTMRRVGVYVDMPELVPETQYAAVVNRKKHPYIYVYKTEDICSWNYTDNDSDKDFEQILLYENHYEYDSESGLPCNKLNRYRHVKLNPMGGIDVQFFNDEDEPIDKNGELGVVVYHLDINEIPFVMFEINESLLKDVADYQIALLNMESADVSYAITSNFPLYIEQFDSNYNSADDIPPYTDEDVLSTEDEIVKAKNAEAKVGPAYGRQYPKETNPPAFINPSAEPLTVAMEKEKQIKKDIKLLINLAVNDLSDKMISAESKKADESGKQTGLACIAYVLENGERKIAQYWGMYESKTDNIIVSYPKDYDLKSDEERYKDCLELWELMEKIPSETFKKTILKRITQIVLTGKVSTKDLAKIEKQIDEAPGVLATVELITKCRDSGLVDDKSASLLLGFKDGLVELAKKDHAEKLKLIQEAQGGEGGAARGVKETQTTQPTSKDEKRGKQQRGNSK